MLLQFSILLEELHQVGLVAAPIPSYSTSSTHSKSLVVRGLVLETVLSEGEVLLEHLAPGGVFALLVLGRVQVVQLLKHYLLVLHKQLLLV